MRNVGQESLTDKPQYGGCIGIYANGRVVDIFTVVYKRHTGHVVWRIDLDRDLLRKNVGEEYDRFTSGINRVGCPRDIGFQEDKW